ncbi:aldehyde dehydrogenase family protein [Streptomyces sp. NPDC005708]|uniref:aldehyde dehydrogenase family protein n=1 Tax=Streptomyces sp. NPDC005708 TaxID=3154564 RepID=UPI0033F57714
MPFHDRIYVGGQWVASHSSTTIAVINPATETVIATVPDGVPADVDAAVAAARQAHLGWWQTPPAERAAFLKRIGAALTERHQELQQLITAEMGAPASFADAVQVPLPIGNFMNAAALAETFAFEQTEGGSTIVREPFGVVGAITPWNYPLHQIAAKVAYALAAGNTVVLKPSEVAPLDAWLLAEVVDAVGLPPGVFNLVSGVGPVVGEAIAAHRDVDLVSFTGSTRAGKQITRAAAETIKRVTLELGGKSPNVLLPDVDLAAVMPRAIQDAMINAGQTCTALTRLVVPRERLAEVEELAKTLVEAIKVGDPTDPATQLGPLVSATQLERVRGYIDQGLAEGAKLITGGSDPVPGLDTGHYVRPTVFSEVTTDMTIHREEIFGPVLAIEAYDSEEEAVHIANDTVYGLAGAVWSANAAKAQAFARRIRAGQIQVNGGAFNINAPFGGYKQSGNGRELGRYGLEDFCEIKSIQQ